MDPEDGRMLPNFITQALRNKPLTIYGEGQFTRSLCYVQDLVDGLLAVMESDRPDAAGRVYNLGNPEEHTILEYAQMVLELIPSSTSTITYLDPVPDDPSRRRPDIGRARVRAGAGSRACRCARACARRSTTSARSPPRCERSVAALAARGAPRPRARTWSSSSAGRSSCCWSRQASRCPSIVAGRARRRSARRRRSSWPSSSRSSRCRCCCSPSRSAASRAARAATDSSDLSFGAAEVLVALLGAAWLARGVRARG